MSGSFAPALAHPATRSVQSPELNRQWLLAARPNGPPKAGDFTLHEAEAPVIGDGQLLLRTLYLSLDPYMRGRMSDAPSYATPVALGQVMVGSTVSIVVSSRHPAFQVGELVLAQSGWQDYAVSDGRGVTSLRADLPSPSQALGVLGMPGFTAYVGLLEIGRPRRGETLVVAAASGPVGSVVGQIALIMGCTVVGVAGGAAKCRFVVDELGFSACLDHTASDFPQQLSVACPRGIDVYFESVGGAVFDAVLPLLNAGARIPLCGLVSQYNQTDPPLGPDRRGQLMGTLLVRRVLLQGFIVFEDFADHFDEFQESMHHWVHAGRVRVREDIVEGLEHAPAAFIGLLEGRNFGKLLIRVGSES